MTDSNFAADRPPKLATKATHLGNNDDISDKEVEILNNIYKKISKSIDNISSLTPSNGVENEEVDDQSNNDDWTVNPIMQKENIMKGKDISENKAKFKKTRNKKACDVCKKKKIKCIYNFDDDRTDMNDERLYEDTVIPSNKQYLGIVCVYCKRNNTKCTFLAPERKRGYKKLSDEEERQLKETPAPKKKKIKEEVRETSIEHDVVDAVKKKAVKLSNAERLKKYDALFDSIFNSNAKQDKKLKIDSFDSELFKKIYDKINQHDTSLNNYEFDGSRNNMINNNYFQIAIDRYEYFLQNKLAGSSGLQFFSLQVPLPSKERAIELIENAWLESFVVFRFYHRPTFIENLNRVYSLKPHEYDEKLIKFLPSLYSVMAVGSLFDTKSDDDFLKKTKNLDDDDEGYRFFLAARNMIDLGSCTDINSIQTTVMLFMFLQCSARLSTCYIYIGVAMRSVLREGYHRFIAEGTPGYSLLDIEMRKRTFFTIYKMDIYVNNMLGLPKAISFMDFDQTLPLEYEDEYITHEGLKLPRDYDPNNNITSVTISNHHTKLLMILEEVVEKLYPVKKTNNVIPHKVVIELEVRLDSWVKQLPKYLVPGIDEKEIPNDFLFKANRLLHFSYLQVQIVLYRPFIHYLILDKNQSLQYDELSIKRGEMCKNVAKKAILLAKEMLQKKLLNGNHWFSIYTIFFSVAGLLFYVHESTPDTKNAEEMAEYNECNELCIFAKTILDSLKGSSKAANRTYNVLNALFDSLNKRTKMYMELSFKKNRNPQATTEVRNDKKNEKNEFENAQKNIGTPLTDTISMFMQAVAAEHSVPQDYPSEVGNFATDNNAQRHQFINQAMMSPIDDEPFFGIDTPNSINSYHGSNNLPVMNNGNGYGSHMFATVSGNNLPLPVIQKQKNSDVSGRKKEDLPFDIVKEEQSPMFMMKNPEDDAKKDEESPDTTYISGVFDQLDMQLFGRYLPPYMTRNVNNNKK